MRPVIQFLNGHLIKEYESISAAARETGVSIKCIRNVLNGTQKHAGGYEWHSAKKINN